MKVTQGYRELGGARLGFWAVVVLSIFAWAPATYPGYWQGLEGFAPVLNSAQPNLLAHIATPLDLWRSSGSDAFLLARPLLLVGIEPTAAVRVSFILYLLLGGLGVYSWLAPRLGDRGAGLAGLLYMLLPPVLATTYIRGSLSDATILAMLPMALAGINIYAANRSVTAGIVGIIAMIWMWRAQAGLALLACAVLLLYAWLVERQPWAVLIVAVSSLAGGLSLWSVWGARAAFSPFGEHFLTIYQLFAWDWQVAPSEPGWQDRYPFQLGIVAIMLALISIWQWWISAHRGDRQLVRLWGFCLVGVLVIVSLSLGWAAPLWRWSGAQQLLTYPWQVILLALPFLAGLAGSVPALHREFATPPLWAALLIVVVLGSYPDLTTKFTQLLPPERPIATIGDQQNLVILKAQVIEQTEPSQAELQVTWQVLQPLTADYNIFFHALTGNMDNPALVAQVDGQPFEQGPPADRWQPGEIYSTIYRLDLPIQVEGESLRYLFGFYDWRNGQRLPVNGGMDDKLTLYGN